MNLKSFLIIILLFIISTETYAYSEKEYLHIRDSLQRQVNISTGREHVDALFSLIRHIVAYEQDTAEALIRQEFKLAEKLNYKNGLAEAYQNQADLLYHRDELAGALENFQQAASLFEETGNYKEAGTSLFKMVPIYHFTGNQALTTDLFPRIITFYHKGNSMLELSLLYHWMAYYYNNFDIEPDSAKMYLRKALDTGKKYLPAIEIWGICNSLGLAYTRSEDYDSAIIVYDQSLQLLDGTSDDEVLARMIGQKDKAWAYLHMGRDDSARSLLIETIGKAKETSYLFIIGVCSRMMGDLCKKNSEWNDAGQYYLQSHEACLAIIETGRFYSDPEKKYASEWMGDATGWIKYFTVSVKKYWTTGLMARTCYDLSDLYRMTGDKDKELKHYREYHAWSDSLSRIERARDLVGLKIAYDTQLKDRQIETLSQDNELKELQLRQTTTFLIGLGAFVILSISILLLLLRQRKLKAEQEKTELKQKLFQMQINPHFIFNSLSGIQHLVVEEDAEKASIYLAKFSNLIRNILYSSFDENITLENEIKNIDNYLALQKLRYDKKFDYSIEVDHELDAENIEIPVMLIQPFIENAIEHGIKHKEGKGNIQIRIGRKSDSTIFEVEDDGVGRERARFLLLKQEESHKSLATVITRERIVALNRKSKKKVTLEIIDLKDDEGKAMGTLVRFALPI